MTTQSIELEGLSVARTGEFVRPEVIEALDRLGDFGAQLVKISRRMELLVVGDRGYSKQPEKAHRKGIPIVTEQQFASLLEHGSLEYDADEAEHLILHVRQGPRVFGEVRSILNQPSAYRSWGHLCTLLDQCEAPEQEMLVDYIAQQMVQWSEEQRLACIAPLIWLEQLERRERAPKFRLIRALDLSMGTFDVKQCAQIIMHEDLHDLLALRLTSWPAGHTSHDVDLDVFRALERVTWCETLVSIGVGNASMRAMDRLHRNERLRRIRRLEVLEVPFGWSYRGLDVFCECLDLFSDGRAIEWIKLGQKTVAFLGWALSGERGEDGSGEPYDSRECLGHAWAQMRSVLSSARGLDMSGCVGWNIHMARFLEEFDPVCLRVAWPGCVRHVEGGAEEVFYNPMTYMRHYVEVVPLVLSTSPKLECVHVDVTMASVDELVSMRGRELVEVMGIPDAVTRVVLHGGVDERVRGWFEGVLGAGRVEVF